MSDADIDYTKVPRIVHSIMGQNMDKPLREIVRAVFLELKKERALHVHSIEDVYRVPGINNMVANIIEKAYFDEKIGNIKSAPDQAREDVISLIWINDVRIKTKNAPPSVVDQNNNYIKRDLSLENDANGEIIPQLDLQFEIVLGYGIK